MSEAATETTEATESTEAEATEEKPAEKTEKSSEEEPEEKTDSAEKKDTILGKDAKKEGDDKEDGESDDAGPKAGDFQPSDLKMPEGMLLTEAWQDKIEGSQVWQKLTQPEAEDLLSQVGEWEAQKQVFLIDAQNEQTQGWADTFEKSSYVVDRGEGGAELAAQEAVAFRDALLSAKDTKGNLLIPQEQQTELLSEFTMSGIGSHPALIIMFSQAARLLGLTESQPPGGGLSAIGQKKKSAAQRMFPLSAPETDAA